MSSCSVCGAEYAVPGYGCRPLDADGGPHVCAVPEVPVPDETWPEFAAAERRLRAAERILRGRLRG